MKEHYAKYRQTKVGIPDDLNTITPEPNDAGLYPIYERMYGSRLNSRTISQQNSELEVICKKVEKDVLQWWPKKQADIFSLMNNGQRLLGGVPRSSAPVERIFSSAKHVVPYLRGCLKPTSIRQCKIEKHQAKKLTRIMDDEGADDFHLGDDEL
ncbi:unnamed protein product [Absidia cylindrospora]